LSGPKYVDPNAESNDAACPPKPFLGFFADLKMSVNNGESAHDRTTDDAKIKEKVGVPPAGFPWDQRFFPGAEANEIYEPADGGAGEGVDETGNFVFDFQLMGRRK
jgi:hypothetical protein